jgi:LPXTG-motif cell wall-anchored protein
MNEVCETLADTGQESNWLLLAAVLLLFAGLAVFLRYRYGFKPFVLMLVVAFAVALSPYSAVLAQTVDECDPDTTSQGQNDAEEPQGSTVLILEDDTGFIELPTEFSGNSYLYMALFSNDTAPTGDPIDGETLDLDTETPGVQTSISLLHPDDSDYSCGSISVAGSYIVAVEIAYNCYNEEFEALTLPLDFSIEPFLYSVVTEDSVEPEEPALVTVTIGENTGVVQAVSDGGCTFDSPFSVLDNDSTSVGSLDPATVDLNPNLPGIQTSVEYSDEFISTTVSVNGSGVVTAPDEGTYFYTVQNTNGDVSNVAAISVSGCS